MKIAQASLSSRKRYAGSSWTTLLLKKIRPFIDHAFNIGVERMVLVCPERLWACKVGWEQFHRHRPARFINLNWREDYLGKGGSPDRALAISIWENPCAMRCSYEVWSKPLELWLAQKRRRFVLSGDSNASGAISRIAAARRKRQGMARTNVYEWIKVVPIWYLAIKKGLEVCFYFPLSPWFYWLRGQDSNLRQGG